METKNLEKQQHDILIDGDRTGIKMEGVKSEEVLPCFNDENLKVWSEPADGKNSILLPVETKCDDLKKEEEGYEEYSDGEIRDEKSTGKDDTETLTSIMTVSHRKSQCKNALKHTKNGSGSIRISNQAKSLIEKLCEGAPVSPTVASLCQFQCKVCKGLFHGWNSLYNHFNKLHQHIKLSIAEVDKCVTKTVSYICKICSVVTLCDYGFIRKHVRKHDLLIGQYIKKFDTDNPKLLPQEVTYSNDIIGSLCHFQCRECGAKFTNRATSRKHQINIHGSKTDTGEKMIKRVVHKCKLCGRSISCEIQNLIPHLKLVHGLSPKEYCKQTGCKYAKNIHYTFLKSNPILQSLPLSTTIGNYCIFECKQCLKTFNAKTKLCYHIKKHHIKKVNVFAFLKIGFSYKCNFCPKVLLCDKSIVTDHLKHSHGPEYLKLKKPTLFKT